MKHFFSFFLFSFFCGSLCAQNIRVYRNAPGDTSIRRIIKVISLPGGAWVHLGEIETSETSTDVALTKVSADGTIIWQKSFGSSEIDAANNFVRLSDGGFAIIGFTDNTDVVGDKADMLLIKTDSLGVPQWAKKFGGAAFEEGFGISELANGELLAFGRTDSFSSFTVMAMGAKFSSNGDILWQNVYRFGSQSSYLYKAFENSATEVVVCGYAWDNVPGTPFFDPLFVKINPLDGSIINSNRLRMNNLQILYDWARDSDGNIYWAGVSSSNTVNHNVMGKVSPALLPVWSQTFNSSRAQRIWDIEIVPTTGDIAYAGFIQKTTSDQSRRNGTIGRVSSLGVLLESAEFGVGDTNTTELTGISFADGKVYAVGYTYMYGNKYGAGISIQINSQNFTQICNGSSYSQTTVNKPSTNVENDTVFSGGTVADMDLNFGDNNEVMENICTYTATKENLKSETILVYPNPGFGVYNLKFPAQMARNMKVYQSNGVQIISKEINAHESNLNLESFPAGIFKVVISTGHEVFQTTLVKK